MKQEVVLEKKSDDELRLLSVSDDVHPSRRSLQTSKLQHGIAMPPVSDEENKLSTREAPQFKPRLQVLHLLVMQQPVCNPCYRHNLGMEFLSSLQKIRVRIYEPEFESYS